MLARFASAGCFKVYYPYKEIAEYLALSWGVDIMAKEWLKYDEEVRNFNCLQRKNAEAGIDVIEQTDAEAFVNAVKRVAEKEENLAKEIMESEEDEKNAEKFVAQLERYINVNVEEEMYFWDEIRDEKRYLDLGMFTQNGLREFFNYYSKLEKNISMIREKVTTNIEYEVMKLHDNEEEWKDVFLEFYLKKKKRDEWRSPNEIRYILSKIVLQLTDKYESAAKELENARSELSRYIKREIDIEKSDIIIKETFSSNNLRFLIDYKVLLNYAYTSFHKGFSFYIGFLTMALCIISLFAFTKFFIWRLLNSIFIIFSTNGISIDRTISRYDIIDSNNRICIK